MSDDAKLGPTGEFPEGKLNANDEGGLRFAIGSEGDKILLNFGTTVTMVGFSPTQAVQMAELLIKHAREVAKRTGEILTVSF